MTKSTYKEKKHLVVIRVSKDYSPHCQSEGMIEGIAESSDFDLKAEGKRNTNNELLSLLKSPSLTPVAFPSSNTVVDMRFPSVCYDYQ